MIAKFVAGFVLWMNLGTPAVFLHPGRFDTYDECRAAGDLMFKELTKYPERLDILKGECVAIPLNTSDDAVKTLLIEMFQIKTPTDA